MGEQQGTFPNHLGVQDRWVGVCCQCSTLVMEKGDKPDCE